MAELDELESLVNGLQKYGSSDETFRAVYQRLEEAAKNEEFTASNQLFDVVTNFRDNKLNPRETLNRLRADAKDLHENLGLGSVQQSIRAITNRNDALKNLFKNLNEQSKKAIKDAALLTTIKEILDRTTATVEVVNAYIDALEESDGSVKKILKASVEALAEVSSIFKSQES